MTPGARVAAAIDVLDRIREGAPAERALTTWARASRFAGSKDRAAVRDHVFDVLRARRSLGDGTGRSLMIALARREGWDVEALFSGDGHAPPPVVAGEGVVSDLSAAARVDLPDWLWPVWQNSLGDQAEQAALAQQTRAPVYLRVNLRRASLAESARQLAAEDIQTRLHPQVPTALQVTHNPRRVKTSRAYQDGLVELQDAASQFAVLQLPITAGMRVLDYCAGGGGKALAIADAYQAKVFAHDIAPERMRDLSVRADRAQVTIAECATDRLFSLAPFDLVLCDAPCSGSGTWRRTPDAKWRLTEADLTAFQATQIDVITRAATLLRPGGILAYATCSVLDQENDAVVDHFISTHANTHQMSRMVLSPGPHWDGFYLSCLKN